MPKPKVLILRAPGTNCDHETAYAFECAGAVADLVHINRLLEDQQLANRYEIFCLPGGFSYGDDIAAGQILATQFRHHLDEAIHQFKDAGKLILGICNGFQVLTKSGALYGATNGRAPATLTWNDSAKFEDRWVNLKVVGEKCVFLRDIQSLYLPIAHAEGKFVTRDQSALDKFETNGQLVLRYTMSNGVSEVRYPANPNGSQANVAGVCDSTGRVFGLMPHPERHIDPTHHPQWTRRPLVEKGDGTSIFENAVAYFK
jgi:phosphoribosylformylglycinamidine synthase